MRTVSQEDELLQRAANPRTGLITPFVTGPVGNGRNGKGDYLAANKPGTAYSERQACSSRRGKQDGSCLNLVKPLNELSNEQNPVRSKPSPEYKIPRKAVGSKSSARLEVFQGLKDKIVASMSKERMHQKGSTRAQLLNEDPFTNPFLGLTSKSTPEQIRSDQLCDRDNSTKCSVPPESMRLSQNLPRTQFLHPSHFANVESTYRRPAHLLPPHLQRPQGPRAAPIDRIGPKAKEAHQRPRMHRQHGDTSVPRMNVDEVDEHEITTRFDPKVKGDGAILPSCRTCTCANCIDSRSPIKTYQSTRSAGESGEGRSELIEGNGSEERSEITQKFNEKAEVANENKSPPTVIKAGTVVHGVPGSGLARTKSMLHRLDGLSTLLSRADRKIHALPALPHVKWVGQRLLEMVIHVFTTLNHASPALQVLRSPNAGVGEYGSALRDFFRAIVYLLVLLNVLLVIARAVRFIIQLFTALALPIRLLWAASRWAFMG
ncbi:MAG: hypothetical protein Q9191_002811 [Dirinaria sp. TL-2023a]